MEMLPQWPMSRDQHDVTKFRVGIYICFLLLPLTAYYKLNDLKPTHDYYLQFYELVSGKIQDFGRPAFFFLFYRNLCGRIFPLSFIIL